MSVPFAGASEIRAVTFDCWNTLLHEPDPQPARARRIQALVRAAAEGGVEADADAAAAALSRAWQQHITLWERGVCSGALEVAGWSLAALGADASAAPGLAGRFAEAALEAPIPALDGARETLERLAACGVRRALICDTGLSPGRVVRELLARAGLLDHLEVLVFSDEQGVPKPHRRVFEAALEPLAVPPAASVHVGDLRRTDVAGGRAAGMGTVRIRDTHDDASAWPEADAVVESHGKLLEVLLRGPA